MRWKFQTSRRRLAGMLLLLTACDAKNKHAKQSRQATHQLLLKSSAHEAPLDFWQLPSCKREAITSRTFNRTTDVVRYRKNRIYFSCLTTAAGCTDYTADIAVRHDTIQVILNSVSDLMCTESAVWCVTGEIANKTRKRYIFCK